MLVFITRTGVGLLLSTLLATGVQANETVIRKNLPERLPNLPKIDEVRKTPIPGLWEVRIGAELIYTDDNADHIVQGTLFDARTRTNLTEARINALNKIEFAQLPLKDAVVIKQGNGVLELPTDNTTNSDHNMIDRNAVFTPASNHQLLPPIIGTTQHNRR